MGTPQVAVSCIPMVEWGINVLNLPVISQFVNASIATAANEYVAPKSMSLEIGKMLLGDDVKKEVDTVGILWVRIKKAVGLSKQDKRGSSDAYITLAYSKVRIHRPDIYRRCKLTHSSMRNRCTRHE